MKHKEKYLNTFSSSLIAIAFLFLAFGSDGSGSSSSSSSNSPSSSSSTSSSSGSSSYGSKTCSWCGKSFSGNGYNYVMGECINGSGDYYTKCSMKCCNEARKSDPNLSKKWKQ